MASATSSAARRQPRPAGQGPSAQDSSGGRADSAIALMNVLLPSLVKRRHPARAGLLIGVYLLSLAAGAILASLIAVPIFQASGGSVPLALGIWALPAAVAALVWLPQWRFRTAPAGARPPEQRRLLKVSRYPLAWQVMGFMGLQSLIYYATLSWLPTLFRARGADPVHAGTLLAVMNLGNAVTLLLIPMLAHRTRDQRWLIALTVASASVGLAGAWFAPMGGAAASSSPADSDAIRTSAAGLAARLRHASVGKAPAAARLPSSGFARDDDSKTSSPALAPPAFSFESLTFGQSCLIFLS